MSKHKTIWASMIERDDAPRGLARLAEETSKTSSFFKRVQARGAGNKQTETQRVVALPIVEYPDVDLTDEFKTSTGAWKLRPIQSKALTAIREARGGLFSIGVGWGKTLIGMLAGQVVGAKYTIFLAPASTVAQLESMYNEIRHHFNVGKMSFISYGRLSRPDGTSLLKKYTKRFAAKDLLLVCDEVHKIKRKESARTKRVIRFLQENPDVKVVGMSGTLTSRGLKDMAHIAEMTLREASPLPRNRNHLNAWAECIDVDGRPGQSEWEVVRPLWNKYNQGGPGIWFYNHRQRRAKIREAFQQRFRTTAGVVCSEKGALGCSLEVTGRVIDVPDAINEIIEESIANDMTPDGEPFQDDSSKFRALKNVCAGFYYKWVWPDGVIDEDWLDARYEWSRCVRRELTYSAKEGYDSPLLVANRIGREVLQGKRGIIHRAWLGWFGSELNKQKPPPTVPVWIDDYLVRDAVAWARSQKEPVILWYQSKAVEQALEAWGVTVYGAGNNPPKEGVLCGMSIRAHGVGKNLQHGWRRQLVLEPPSSGNAWEQLLGRTHRPGQIADAVECLVYTHTEAFQRAIQKARLDARYIQDTTGSRQKMLYCVYGGNLV